LFTSLWRTISSIAVMTPVAFTIHKCGNDIAVLTAGRLPVLLYIHLTFFANTWSTAFAFLLELRSAVCTLDSREWSSALRALLLTLW
jgi:hypothetical protein